VLPIGIEGLARSISDNLSIFKNLVNYNAMQLLVECELQANPVAIRDATVETFFMYGDIDDSLIDEAVSGIQRVPYLILRQQATNVFTPIRKGKNVLVFSELGNGKTTLIRILQTMLLVEGYRVFNIRDSEEDFIEGLDLLMKSSQQSVVIVDGVEPCLDLLRHLSYTQPHNIHFLAATRTADYEHIGPQLVESNLKYIPICIDKLSEEDILSFIKIVDNLGYWGSDAGKSIHQKLKIVRQDHKSQLSLTLRHLFKAPQMRNRLDSLLLALLENKTYRQIIFVTNTVHFRKTIINDCNL
jgi:energy-coupling factor transporter ATP-binding protein EcfA2